MCNMGVTTCDGIVESWRGAGYPSNHSGSLCLTTLEEISRPLTGGGVVN